MKYDEKTLKLYRKFKKNFDTLVLDAISVLPRELLLKVIDESPAKPFITTYIIREVVK